MEVGRSRVSTTVWESVLRLRTRFLLSTVEVEACLVAPSERMSPWSRTEARDLCLMRSEMRVSTGYWTAEPDLGDAPWSCCAEAAGRSVNVNFGWLS